MPIQKPFFMFLLWSPLARVSTLVGAVLILGYAQPLMADIQMETIITESTPTEMIQESALMPSQTQTNDRHTGSSGIERAISNQLPLPVSTSGTPGSYSSFRGLGRSSDEMNFQMLGVPLNGPQGGGFDISSFPQFLWSEYRYQSGPSLGSFDARASSGTFTLVPWTQKALSSKEDLSFRFLQNHSFAGQSQVSLGAQAQQKIAALAGYSDGFARGPSGGLSSKWGLGKLQSQLHFVGSRLDSETPGPREAPTPQARQVTSRLIPVLQTSYQISEQSKFKNSLFFDSTRLSYNDPDSGYSDDSKIRQYGVDNAWTDSITKLALGAKFTTYETLRFTAKDQIQFRLSGSHTLRLGPVALEPLLQLAWINTQTLTPEGSLTLRQEWIESGISIYSRASFSRRIPSLVDLHYQDPFFRGNPFLRPEKNYTLLVGGDLPSGIIKNSLHAYLQAIEDTQLAHYSGAIGTMKNSGNAWVASITHQIRILITKNLDFFHSLNWSNSRITQLGTPYPYLPNFLSLLNLDIHATGERPDWSVLQTLRTSTQTQGGVGHLIGGYTLWDVSSRFLVARLRELGSTPQSLYAGIRIENLLNRTQVEWVRGYPLPGRTWVIQVMADF